LYEGCRVLQRESDVTLNVASFAEMDWSVYETEILNGYYFLKKILNKGANSIQTASDIAKHTNRKLCEVKMGI
jgi:hypothetical protein